MINPWVMCLQELVSQRATCITKVSNRTTSTYRTCARLKFLVWGLSMYSILSERRHASTSDVALWICVFLRDGQRLPRISEPCDWPGMSQRLLPKMNFMSSQEICLHHRLVPSNIKQSERGKGGARKARDSEIRKAREWNKLIHVRGLPRITPWLRCPPIFFSVIIWNWLHTSPTWNTDFSLFSCIPSS